MVLAFVRYLAAHVARVHSNDVEVPPVEPYGKQAYLGIWDLRPALTIVNRDKFKFRIQ